MKIATTIAGADGSQFGHIRTIAIERPFALTESTSARGGTYYRIIANPHTDTAYEIGAAFPRTKGDTNYLSVELDDPMFAVKPDVYFWPNGKGGYDLIWHRKEEKPEPSAAPRSRGQAKVAEPAVSLTM